MTVAQSRQDFSSRTLRVLKRTVQKLPTSLDGVVVASFGRAGSTVVYGALSEAMARRRFLVGGRSSAKIVKAGSWFLDAQALNPGVIYKTHDYPDALSGKRNLRAVFLFGSTIDAALSVYEQKRSPQRGVGV